VIWVTLSFRNSGNYSDDSDDTAAAGFSAQIGNKLGNSWVGRNSIVIKGVDRIRSRNDVPEIGGI
jgi:hypothetical protein